MWLKLTDRLAGMGGGPSGSGHMLGSCRYRIIAAALAAAVVILFAPAGAYAAPPKITSAPVIRGTAQVAGTLTASAVWTGQPEPTAAWQWLRCASAGENCAPIATATTDRYVPTTADVGSVLRVNLTVSSPPGSDQARSAPTAVVTAAPAPTATPTPTASPVPPAPTPAPPVSFEATPVPTPTPTPPATSLPASPPSGPRLLRPVPVIRIKGVLTASGARITLLTVRAPSGARLVVLCRGRDCPVRRYAPRRPVRRLSRFERSLRAGTRIEVMVLKAGYVGKRTVIVIRRGAAPRRTDGCASAAERRVRCPSP